MDFKYKTKKCWIFSSPEQSEINGVYEPFPSQRCSFIYTPALTLHASNTSSCTRPPHTSAFTRHRVHVTTRGNEHRFRSENNHLPKVFITPLRSFLSSLNTNTNKPSVRVKGQLHHGSVSESLQHSTPLARNSNPIPSDPNLINHAALL